MPFQPSRKTYTILILLLAGLLLAGLRGAASARPGLSSAARVRLAAPLALEGGAHLAWAETSPSSTESSLWVAPAADLAGARLLASVTHRAGYPPAGSVSPDGRWVVIFIIPPGVDERAARLDGGELWLAASDGSRLERLAAGVAQPGPWSPDSSAVSWLRLVALPDPKEKQIPFRTELYRSSLDGAPSELLFADESAYGIVPLGWSTDGAQYLAARVNMEGAWSVQAYTAGGKPGASWPLPGVALARAMQLSPDGTRLLVENAIDGEDQVLLFSLAPGADSGAQAMMASAPLADAAGPSPVAARWLADGARLWLFRAGARGETSAQVLALGENQPQVTAQGAASAAGAQTLLPLDASRDGSWLAWMGYPRPQSDVYLQTGIGGPLEKVPQASPENWISVFGWIERGDW